MEKRLLPTLIALAHELVHITDADVEFGQLRVERQKRGIHFPGKFADIITDGQGVVVKLLLAFPVLPRHGLFVLALRVVGYDPEGRDIVFASANDLLYGGKAGHGVNTAGRHFSGHGVTSLMRVFKRQLSVGEVAVRLIKQALGFVGVHFQSYVDSRLSWVPKSALSKSTLEPRSFGFVSAFFGLTKNLLSACLAAADGLRFLLSILACLSAHVGLSGVLTSREPLKI
ncbi:hypothetical protein [Azospirillum baldaniorum]|uniref:hypothetical protein n=1 Tax=Azospirillum baldaniorum TaxID=1064539 RepID=UPI0011A8E2CE|nr:hypothetical protein [Azospirillum baldaniorum]